MKVEDLKVEVKIGLEIHQQLDTKKLFCNCPSLIKENAKPDAIIKRNLFAVSGELGKIDIAALYEQEKNKNHFYYFYNDCCCLIELDEAPPLPINREALKIAIQICMLLNAEILPLTQVMRKIVIDGSDVTGFQRTMLLARNGRLEYEFEGEKKSIIIKTICLEEEAAKKIKEEGNNAYWSLDRYGIPLIEIATEPSIKEFEEAKVVALAIGEVLRACKVKRGLGTIRQDLNVSVVKGARTEIKGVQEPKLIPKVLEREVRWQIEQIEKGVKLEASVKKAEEEKLVFLRPLPGAERLYPETDIPLVIIDDNFIEEAKRELPKSISELRNELLKEIENSDLVEGLIKSREKFNLWKKLVEDLNIKEKETKKFIANLLINMLKEISRETKNSEIIILEKISQLLPWLIEDIIKGKISRQAIREILFECIQGKSYNEVKQKYRIIDKKELEKMIIELSKTIEERYLMQEAIKRFKLNAEVKDIIEIVNKIIKSRR